MAVGDTLTLDLQATVDPGTSGTLLQAVAAVSASGRGDPSPGDNADTTVVTVPDVDLALTLTASATVADEADTLLYTLSVVNQGADSALTVQAVDLLPAGLTLEADSTSQGSYVAGTGAWNVGPIAHADSARLWLTASVDPGTAGSTLNHNASLTASDPWDNNAANDTPSVPLTVRAAELGVQLSVDDSTAVEGSTVQFTTVLTNTGPDSTSGVTLLQAVPAGLSYLTHGVTAGTWVSGTGVWTVGPSAAGASDTLTVTATVDPGTAGAALITTAGVTASAVADPNAGNNTASSTVNVPNGMTATAVQNNVLANPGEADVALLSVSVDNSHAFAATLDQIRLANTSSGPGTPTQLDAAFGTLTLYHDDGDLLFEPGQDVALDTGSMAGGIVSFTGLGFVVASGGAETFHVGTSIGLAARDGDALDVALADSTSLTFLEAVTDLTAWPLAPAGTITVDGMGEQQIVSTPLGAGTVMTGSSATVWQVTVPPNGYAADTLNELHVTNGGNAVAGTDIAALYAWADGGDGTAGLGAGDDVLLGTFTWSGSAWDLTGLTAPIPTSGLLLFLTADIAPGATPGRTVQPRFPTSPAGVIVASTNDGPVDGAAAAPDKLTITSAPSTIAVSASQTPGTLSPDGGAGTPVIRLDLINTAAAAETLETVVFDNTTVGPGTLAQRDAEWTALTLSVTSRTDLGADRTPVSFSGGQLMFTKLGLTIAGGDTLTLVVSGGASVAARDGDLLDLQVTDAARIAFADSTVQVTATGWPLSPAGAFSVDGMMSAQAAINSDRIPPNLLTGSSRSVALLATLPANGYETDTLRTLDVVNLGTAQAGTDITGMELWRDVDGDGFAEPDGDDSAGLLGNLVFTGARWEITALALPLVAPGSVVFATVDVAEQATVGATLRLSIPANGMTVHSNNDGPRDAALTGSTVQTVTTADRITLGALQVPAGTALPGQDGITLLQLTATNDYTVPKTITDLTVTNATTGIGSAADFDTEAGVIRLYADSLAAPELGQTIFSSSRASFSGLGVTLAPGETRSLFVTSDVSLNLAADGDILSAHVAGDPDIAFSDPTTVVATYPVTSQALCTVDGMIAAQIGENVAPPVTLGPSEGPVLALDVVIPSNGYAPDRLQGLTVVNHGTAVAGDIDQMRLWRDGGDGVFDAGLGDDFDLGPMSPLGGEWTSPALGDSIPVGGRRCFVAITSSPALNDGTTVQLAIPVDGITVESGNDGPIDQAVENDETIVLSTAALLATLDISPNSSTLAGTVTATMTVRNVSDSTVTNITPSALTPDNAGVLGLLTGPSPASFSLTTGQSNTFTWTFSADSAGTVRLTGNAAGTEQGSGLPRQSLDATSDIHRVFLQAQELEVFPVESMPFSISRGQTDVVPLSLTLTNNAGTGGSDIEVLGLRIRLEDGNGNPVDSDSLFSRVVVNEGTNVYLDKTSFGTNDSLDLTLAVPVLIPASGQVTLSLSLDIADSTSVPEFRLSIPDGAQPWFVARDATSQAPASILLAPGVSYPITSGLARIVSEATQLDVASTGSSPVTAGQGQDGVRLLDLEFLNPDPDSLAADIRVSSFEVVLTDSAGAAFPQPDLVLERIRVSAAFQTLVDRAVSSADDSTMTLLLSPLLSVPVNNPVPLTLEADLRPGAPLGDVRLRLADSTGVDARDANTGAPLPAIYATQPVAGGVVTIVAPADTLLVTGQALFPAKVPVGTPDQPALRITLRHPGDPTTGDISLEALTVAVRGLAGQPLVPATFVDKARVMRGTTEVGVNTGLPTTGGEFTVSLGGQTLAPGESDTLDLWIDVEVSAPAVPIHLNVGAAGIVAIDAALSVAVATAPDSGAVFPLTSGITQLEAPARDLVVGFDDAMPAVLAAQTDLTSFGTVTFTNPADVTAGNIELDQLTVRASTPDGLEIDLGAAVVRVEAWLDGVLWEEVDDIDINDGKAVLTATTPLVIAPEQPRAIELRARFRPEAGIPSLRLGLDHPDIGVVQPQSSLLTIGVSPEEGRQFPYWTQPGNFSAATLEESWSNFPNPFAAGRSQTNFAFFLVQPARVSLKLYTARGALVQTLLDQAPLAAGLHQDRAWDGRNGNGDVVVNGVYLAEIAVQYDNGSVERYLRKVAVVR
ncbi:MAG: DUF11 domain-containing protein [Gemmatimonadetes bacterium]|nr:DUF11 domain-containing protein [Gemmatimonadota bacterium]